MSEGLMRDDKSRWRNYQAWLQHWLADAEARLREADIHECARRFAHVHLCRAVRAARGGDIDAMNLHLDAVTRYLTRVSS